MNKKIKSQGANETGTKGSNLNNPVTIYSEIKINTKNLIICH